MKPSGATPPSSKSTLSSSATPSRRTSTPRRATAAPAAPKKTRNVRATERWHRRLAEVLPDEAHEPERRPAEDSADTRHRGHDAGHRLPDGPDDRTTQRQDRAERRAPDADDSRSTTTAAPPRTPPSWPHLEAPSSAPHPSTTRLQEPSSAGSRRPCPTTPHAAPPPPRRGTLRWDQLRHVGQGKAPNMDRTSAHGGSLGHNGLRASTLRVAAFLPKGDAPHDEQGCLAMRRHAGAKRPLALRNSDAKFAAAEANALLRATLPRWAHAGQQGFITGRSALTNILRADTLGKTAGLLAAAADGNGGAVAHPPRHPPPRPAPARGRTSAGDKVRPAWHTTPRRTDIAHSRRDTPRPPRPPSLRDGSTTAKTATRGDEPRPTGRGYDPPTQLVFLVHPPPPPHPRCRAVGRSSALARRGSVAPPG